MTETFTFVPGEILDFAIKVALATLAGVCIGLEREYKGKNAGLKTNTLVALGACAFVLISFSFQGEENVDLTRVLGQVVTGIGFLGAGVILQIQDKVKGLSTAATIWCSAAAGCLAATFMLVELGILTVLVVVINIVFSRIDRKIEEQVGNQKQE